MSKKITVLIVDDDLKNRFALKAVLRAKGYEFLEAENGKDCLKILRNSPHVDIVLMDIMMPVMDGYSAIKEIRKDNNLNGIPIIAVSALAMKNDSKKCLEVGADDYISKPVDITVLQIKIRQLLIRD